MFGCDTKAIAASMLNAKRAGDLPEVQDVSNPHHRTGRPATASRALRQSAISSNAGSGPNPTGASLINLLPEARYVSVIQKDSLTSTAAGKAAILATARRLPCDSETLRRNSSRKRAGQHQRLSSSSASCSSKWQLAQSRMKRSGMRRNLTSGGPAATLRPEGFFRGILVVELQRASTAVIAATLAGTAKLLNQFQAAKGFVSHALRSLSIRRRNNSAVEMPSRSASAFNHSSWGCVRDTTSLIMRTSVILW
jgi:hypothetical protein